MIQHIFKAALFIAIAAWFKPRARGVMLLVVGLIIIFGLHYEFKDYVRISGSDDYLLLSYFIKYILLSLLIASYYVFVEVRLKIKNVKNSNPIKNYDEVSKTSSSMDDGFDFLREKSKLESKGEKIIKGVSDNGK